MNERARLAILALPIALLACAPREPAVQSDVVDSLAEGQRMACRAAVAQQTGLTSADVTDSFASVSPSGTAVYNMSSTAGNFRCEVDNAYQVVSLSPLASEQQI